MSNYVKGLVAVVILIVIWGGISYLQSSSKTSDKTNQTDVSCDVSSGGG